MPVQPLLGPWAPVRAGASWRATASPRLAPLIAPRFAGWPCCCCASRRGSGRAGFGLDQRRVRLSLSRLDALRQAPAAQAGLAYDDPQGGTRESSGRPSSSGLRAVPNSYCRGSSTGAMQSAFRPESASRQAATMPLSRARTSSTTAKSMSASSTETQREDLLFAALLRRIVGKRLRRARRLMAADGERAAADARRILALSL